MHCRELPKLGIIVSTTKNRNNCLFCTFISPIYTFSLAGKLFVYRPSQNTNREKYSYKLQHQSQNADFDGIWTTHPSISSLIERAFSIFPQKWTDLIHQRCLSNSSLPRRYFVYKFKMYTPWMGKILNTSLVGKNEIKYKKCTF